MNRRDFLKLSFTSLLAFLLKGKTMPITQNFSGDTMLEIIKDLYQKTGETPPSMLMDTLVRQVEEERRRDEILKSWIDLKGNVSNRFLGLPFIPISSTVLEEDKSEIIIQIPGQYKHLLVMGQGRVNGSGTNGVQVVVQFNGDTGVSNYQVQTSAAIGTAFSAAQDLTYFGAMLSLMVADTAAANYAGVFFAFIPHYNSTYYKSVIRVNSFFSGAGSNAETAVSQWTNTSPIQSMRIFPDTAYPSAKIETGSLISVYGIM